MGCCSSKPPAYQENEPLCDEKGHVSDNIGGDVNGKYPGENPIQNAIYTAAVKANDMSGKSDIYSQTKKESFASFQKLLKLAGLDIEEHKLLAATEIVCSSFRLGTEFPYGYLENLRVIPDLNN